MGLKVCCSFASSRRSVYCTGPPFFSSPPLMIVDHFTQNVIRNKCKRRLTTTIITTGIRYQESFPLHFPLLPSSLAGGRHQDNGQKKIRESFFSPSLFCVGVGRRRRRPLECRPHSHIHLLYTNDTFLFLPNPHTHSCPGNHAAREEKAKARKEGEAAEEQNGDRFYGHFESAILSSSRHKTQDKRKKKFTIFLLSFLFVLSYLLFS